MQQYILNSEKQRIYSLHTFRHLTLKLKGISKS